MIPVEELLHLGHCGHGWLSAGARDGNGSGSGGESGGIGGCIAKHESGGEGSVECVSGSGGVDGVDGEAVDLLRQALPIGEIGTARSKFENDGFRAEGVKAVSDFCRRIGVRIF